MDNLNLETIKRAIEVITSLTSAYVSLKAENTQLRNQLQDIRAAIGALPAAEPKAATVTAIKSVKTPKAPRTTMAKRGRKFLFSDAQVMAIRAQHDKGTSVLSLAKEHKVSPPTIYNALTRGLSIPIKASSNGSAGAGKH